VACLTADADEGQHRVDRKCGRRDRVIAERRAAKRGGPTRQFDLVLEASNAGGGIDEVPGGHWKQGSGMGVKSNARRSLTSKSGRTSLYNPE
jgi:hypothetical protein